MTRRTRPGPPGPILSSMDETFSRPLARLVAWGRVGIGVSALAAPTLMARPWIGVDARSSGSRLLARTMGGRDLALGIGCLRALGLSDQEARPWVALGGMADAVDAVATVLAFGSLPRRSRWGILAVTVGAAVVSTRVAVGLDAPAPTDASPGAVTPGSDRTGAGPEATVPG
jgi:hypothetical protein